MAKWNPKDARQYEHIKSSAMERGRSEAEAEEIAARTVNKHRREQGRTPNRTTQGTGNPNKPLEQRTVPELRNLAAELKVSGRSKMKKQELIESIQSR
jgi:hypothetical protein